MESGFPSEIETFLDVKDAFFYLMIRSLELSYHRTLLDKVLQTIHGRTGALSREEVKYVMNVEYLGLLPEREDELITTFQNIRAILIEYPTLVQAIPYIKAAYSGIRKGIIDFGNSLPSIYVYNPYKYVRKGGLGGEFYVLNAMGYPPSSGISYLINIMSLTPEQWMALSANGLSFCMPSEFCTQNVRYSVYKEIPRGLEPIEGIGAQGEEKSCDMLGNALRDMEGSMMDEVVIIPFLESVLNNMRECSIPPSEDVPNMYISLWREYIRTHSILDADRSRTLHEVIALLTQINERIAILKQQRELRQELSIHPSIGRFPGGLEYRQGRERYQTASGTTSITLGTIDVVNSIQDEEKKWEYLLSLASKVSLIPFTCPPEGSGKSEECKVNAIRLIASRVADLLQIVRQAPYLPDIQYVGRIFGVTSFEERGPSSTPISRGDLGPQRGPSSTPISRGDLGPQRGPSSTPISSGDLGPQRGPSSTPISSGDLGPQGAINIEEARRFVESLILEWSARVSTRTLWSDIIRIMNTLRITSLPDTIDGMIRYLQQYVTQM